LRILIIFQPYKVMILNKQSYGADSHTSSLEEEIIAMSNKGGRCPINGMLIACSLHLVKEL
jgi:hypothetical protein